MRNALLLIASLFLLMACEDINNYPGNYGSGNNRYGNDNNYNGYGNDYGHYYPYGTPNYPSNIYWIDGYHPCNGYIYQGYCYRDKHDLQAAIYWDQQHGRDDNWHRKRKQWCEEHDCSRNHDTHDRNDHDSGRGATDANGKPLEPHVERDGEQGAYSPRPHPEQMPRQPHYPSGSYPSGDHPSGNYPSHGYPSHDSSEAPVTRSGRDDNGGRVQQYHQQRVEPAQRPSGESGGSARPVVQQPRPPQEQQKPQGSWEANPQRGGKSRDVNVTPE